MSKIIGMEYSAPELSVYTLSACSVTCVSQTRSTVEAFEEDAELQW